IGTIVLYPNNCNGVRGQLFNSSGVRDRSNRQGYDCILGQWVMGNEDEMTKGKWRAPHFEVSTQHVQENRYVYEREANLTSRLENSTKLQ
ncbi:Uncharacterized protein APZ42_010467, partial [Daphnia magna]